MTQEEHNRACHGSVVRPAITHVNQIKFLSAGQIAIECEGSILAGWTMNSLWGPEI